STSCACRTAKRRQPAARCTIPVETVGGNTAMSFTFHTPINNISDTVNAHRTAGSGSLVVTNGSQFGSTFPLIVTAARAGPVLCILEITGRSSNTLTVSRPIENTSDQEMFAGDTIEMRPTALAITELQAAVNGIAGGSSGQVQYNDG